MLTARIYGFRAWLKSTSSVFLNRNSYKPNYASSAKKKGRDYERAFFCCKRALAHAMNKNHELKIECDGCKEIIGFLELPGYSGDKHNPVAVDFDRPY